jgi:hypothetical protein
VSALRLASASMMRTASHTHSLVRELHRSTEEVTPAR